MFFQVISGGTDQLHQFLDVITPIVVAGYTVVHLIQNAAASKGRLELNENINSIHKRLARDKAELVQNQQDVKQTLAVHIAEDRIVFAQIKQDLDEIKDK